MEKQLSCGNMSYNNKPLLCSNCKSNNLLCFGIDFIEKNKQFLTVIFQCQNCLNEFVVEYSFKRISNKSTYRLRLEGDR